MADSLFQSDGLASQWPGYDKLARLIRTVRDRTADIVAHDDDAAGRDSYGDQYRQTRGSTAGDVLGLIGAVEERTSATGYAGRDATEQLNRADEDNRRHTGFTPEHQ